MKISEEEGRVGIQDVIVKSKEKYHIMCVCCSNSALVLRFTGDAKGLLGLPNTNTNEYIPSHTPVHTITYFNNRSLQVTSTSFSFDGSRMLATVTDGGVYVIPVASLIFPAIRCSSISTPSVPLLSVYFKQSNNKPIASPHEITRTFTIEQNRGRGINIGRLTKAIWWETKTKKDIAIACCSGGFIVLLDIKQQREIKCIPIPLLPKTMQLVISEDSQTTSLLIFGKRGLTAKADQSISILLEGKGIKSIVETPVGVDNKKTLALPTELKVPYAATVLEPLSNDETAEISQSMLSNGCSGISVFKPTRQEVCCFPSSCLSNEGLRYPSFQYHVIPGTTLLFLTSACCIVAHPDPYTTFQKISILSKFSAAAQPRGRCSFPDAGVLQELLLPYQDVMGFASGWTPTPKKTVDAVLPVEGVLFWTGNEIFELRPANDPEALFEKTLLLAAGSKSHSAGSKIITYCESLAKTFRLNIIGLYEKIADCCRSKNLSWALQLYKRADTTPLDFIKRLLQYGSSDDLLMHLLAFSKMGYSMDRIIAFASLHKILSQPRPGREIPPEDSEQANTTAGKTAQYTLSKLSFLSIDSDDNTSKCTSARSGSVRPSQGGLSRDFNQSSGSRTEHQKGASAAGGASLQATATTIITTEVDSTVRSQGGDSHHGYTQYFDDECVMEPNPDPHIVLCNSLSKFCSSDPKETLTTLQLLTESTYIDKAIKLAISSNLVHECFDMLFNQGCHGFSQQVVTRLLEAGYAEKLVSFERGVLYHGTQVNDQLRIATSIISAAHDHHLDITMNESATTKAVLSLLSPKLPVLLINSTKVINLQHCKSVLLKLYEYSSDDDVDICGSKERILLLIILTILRSAQLASERNDGIETGGHSHDDEAIELLERTSGSWDLSTVGRYATTSGRLRVTSMAFAICCQYESAMVFFLTFLSRKCGCGSTPAEIATKAASFSRFVLSKASGPSLSTVRCRCIRIVLSFFETESLPVESLVEVLGEQKTGCGGELLHILTTTPFFMDILPLPFRVQIADGCMEKFYQRSSAPIKVKGPPDVTQGIVLPPAVLTKAGKDRLVLFTCGHPPMTVSKFISKMMELQSTNCPVTCSALRMVAERISKGKCSAAPQGCPKCVYEALKVFICSFIHLGGCHTDKAFK